MTTQEQQPAQPAHPPASRPATLAASAAPGSAIQGTPLKLCHFCGGEWPEGQGDAVQKWNWLATLASAPVACDHQFHFFGDQKERRCNRCCVLESKASAPVAGEAQPVAWMVYASDTHQLKRIVTTDPGDTAAFGCLKMPLYAAPQACPAADGRDALPPLDENLTLILGRPNFACAQLAQMLRANGQTIKHRAEDEQAAVIYFLLSAYLKHGAGWADKASEAVAAIAAQQGEGGGV